MFFRSWGILSLTIAYIWQLYTLWILVQLHEAVPGKRYNRYVELAQAAFGNLNLHFSLILTFSLTKYFGLLILNRGKIGSLACIVSYGLLISRNCDSSYSDRWRDNETLLPNSLWSVMHLKPFNDSGMVSGVYFSMHRSVSTSKPQFHRGTLLNRSRDCDNLLYDGLGSLC